MDIVVSGLHYSTENIGTDSLLVQVMHDSQLYLPLQTVNMGHGLC